MYGDDLRLDQEPDADEVTQAIELAFLDGPADEVVFCGFGEPTMRLDVVLAVTEWLRLRRIRSRLDTNGHGQLLNPDVDVPAALAAAGLDAVSVSLNAADPETYDTVCRPVFGKAYRAVLAVRRRVRAARHRHDAHGGRLTRTPTSRAARRSRAPWERASAPAASPRRAGATAPTKEDER